MAETGVKRATLKDVAERAGVHLSTVSRALDSRTRHLISNDVVATIVEAASQIGYRHNRAAASLRTNRTLSIGIVIPDITNMLFPPIIKGIEDRIAPDGYVAMIGHTDGQASRESDVIEAFQARGVDGLIIASANLADEPIAKALQQGTPIVTVNRRVKDKAVSSVVSDEKNGIATIIRHLATLGHERIGYISGPTAASTGRARLAAFQDWATALQTPFSGWIARASAYREEEGARCALELLDQHPTLTAIVCAADVLALGALTALKARGISCPKDISVAGFNDIPFVDRISPSLTTVRVQHYHCGVAAAEILLEKLKTAGTTKTRHVVLPVSLIARESTGPAG